MADISLYESIAIKHLRAFAILLIISCHLLQGLGSSLAFVFNVGVQIFLVISGFLYGRKTICTRMWLRKRFVAVYIPYIIFLIIVFPIFFLFSPENVNSSKVVAHVLDIQEYLGGVNGLGHLWYMTAIALCYLVTPILQLMKKYNGDMVATIFTLLLVVDIAFLNAILYYIFLYAMVYFLSSCKHPLRVILSYPVFMVLILVFSLLFRVKTGIPIMLRCFVAIMALVATLECFKRYKFDITSGMINWLSKYSYYLYLVHVPLILGPFSLLNFTESIPVNIIIILCVTVISALSLCTLSSKAQFVLQQNIKFLRNA